MRDTLATSSYLPSRRASLAGAPPISELMARALENPKLISLAAGFVDQETLPVAAVQQVAADLFSDTHHGQAALQYGTNAGSPELREQLLSRIKESDHLSVEQVVVTAGSNALLHLVCESLLNPGDIVLCAAPTYLVFLGTVANVDARAYSIATDEHGIIPNALEETLRSFEKRGELDRVKAIYLVPYFDNPSGSTMPFDSAAKIVEIAKRWSRKSKIHVIADEAYRELRYSGEDVPSVIAADPDHDTVIVAGTLSKSFSPGLRVGWGVLPKHLVTPILAQKANIDFGSPNLNQQIASRVLGSNLFDNQVAQLRDNYDRKLNAMLAAVGKFLKPIEGVSWYTPTGGLYVWAQMPTVVDAGPAGKLFDYAISTGMLYVPGQYCFAAEGQPVAYNTMRLSFGVQSCERIEQGIQALAEAVDQVLGDV